MGAESRIEWTDATWSPIRARVLEGPNAGRVGPHCERISPGCQHCYSETFNGRLLPFNGTGLPFNRQSRDEVEIFIDEKILEQPLHWRRPRKIFVCSQTDLFGEWVSDKAIDRAFDVMALCPEHTFMVLTKRAKRMQRWVSKAHPPHPLTAMEPKYPGWPLLNVWLGVSCENQATADERIPLLLQTPAAVRFVSVEPMLGPVDISKYIGYNAEYEINRTDRRVFLPSGPGRPDRGQAGRFSLEDSRGTGQSLEFGGQADTRESTQDRPVTIERLQDRETDAERAASDDWRTSSCLPSFQGADPAGADDQSRSDERRQDRQSAKQPGTGDLRGAGSTCHKGSGKKTEGSEWREERHGEAQRESGEGDSSEAGGGREPKGNSEMLCGVGSNDLKNCARRALGLSWIICGGESGPGARPMHPDWARSLRDQSQAARVPFFFKQWGEWAPRSHGFNDGGIHRWGTHAGDEFFETATPWNGHDDDGSGEAVMIRVGKRAAGRLLDGREWNEFPAEMAVRR
jgi:protein gp37